LGYIPARDLDFGVGVGCATAGGGLATAAGGAATVGGCFAIDGVETTRGADDSTSELTEFGSCTWVGDTFGSVFEVASFTGRSIRRRVVIVDRRIYRVNAFIL